MENQSRTTFLRFLIAQLFIFIIVFGAVHSVQAQGIVYGDNVPAGKKVENDALLWGDDVELAGEIIGDAFIIGSNVNIDGKVQGSLFVIGQNVTINGMVAGTTYSSAMELALGETSQLQRNLYYAGLKLLMKQGSEIQRDLVAVCLLGATMDGSVDRNIRAIIGPVEVFQSIISLLSRYTGKDILPQIFKGSDSSTLQPQSAGLLWLNSFTPGSSGSGAFSINNSPLAQFLTPPSRIVDLARKQLQNPSGSAIDWEAIGIWALARARELVTLLAFGLLGIWLFPTYIVGSARAIRRKPLASTGLGLLGLFLAGNVLGLFILLAILFLFTGLWLGNLTLWELTFSFWAVSFSTLLLVTTIFMIVVLYGTTVIVSFMVGEWIFKRLKWKIARSKMVCLFVGLLIFVLLHSLSFIGWGIGLLVNAIGLGALIIFFYERFKNHEKKEDLAAEPESVIPDSPVDIPG